MSDNRKNKVLLLRPNNTGLFILLFFVIVSILAVNSERAPVIDRQNVRFLFDVSSPYAGDKGYYLPTDVLVLPDGRHILADTSNHRVLVLEPALTPPDFDVVKVIGSVGGGPGQFNYPYAIVQGQYDGNDVIFVADTYNSRVQIFSIDPLDPSYPYVDEFSVLEGQANSILFSMYLDGSDLYVVDSHPNHPRVLVYDVSSSPAVHDASKSFALTGFDEKLVDGVIVGSDGDVYILDEFRVVRIRAGSIYQTFDVPSPNPQLYFPQGLSFGADQNTILVSDTLNNRIVIFTYGGSVWTYADSFGSEGVADGEFQEPKNVHFFNDGTNNYYYVVDTGNNRVQWFQPTSPYTPAGKLARDPVQPDQLDKPAGVAFDHASGLLYVSNTQNNRIDVFDPQDQSHQASFGSFGIHSGSSNLDEFRNGPFGMNFGQDGMLYVADTNNNRLVSFATQAATTPFIEVDANSEAYIAGASNIAVPKGGVQCGTGANAYVFVASTGSSQIAKYDVDGTWVETYPTVEPAEPWNEGGDGQFYYPTEIVCGIEADEIVVVDQGNNRLQVLKFDWTHVENIGLSGATPGSLGELMSPVSVSIKDERYWVLETIGRVTVFDTDGTPLFRFGDDTVFNTPQSISATDAYVFIADTGNNIVHAYCGGLPVPTYEPAPELYQGIAVDLGLAITAGGVVGSVAGYTLVIDIVGPSGNSVPGLTVEAYQTTYPEDTLRIHGVPSAAGTYNVTALFEDDNACSSPTLTFSLVIQDALPFRVDSYSPVAQIPTSGNQNVTLRGLFDWTTTHLVYPGFTLEVFIGGESCTDVHVDGLFIYCNAPEGAGYHNEIEARLSHASLLTPLSSIAPVEFSYKPPNITQIIPFPSTGLPIRGGLVTIVGDSLGKVGTLDRIKVKGLSCTSITAVVGQEHYQLTCVLPYGAGNLNSLFLEVGSDTLGWLNTTTPVFFERPETSCTTPGLVVEAISTSGGGELNICGSNFGMYELGQSFGVTAWEGRREVYIKNRPCTITFINDTLIQCTLPPGAGAFNKVWVNINSDINSWVLVDINVRYPPPILTHIVPSRQLVPGMLITVYGKNFGFWVPEAKKVATIGDNNDCSHVNVLSDGQLTCIVTRGSGDNQPVVVTVADQRSTPILTVDYKDHYTPGLPCEAPLGAQDPWFTDREVCNCFSGYAPSDHTQTDCNVRAVCPGHEISSGVASQFAPQRPTVTFSNDRLILTQIAPIVKDRRDVHIRFEVPHNTLGIPAGTPGAETCGYPGEIWTKTVDSLDCNDLYHLSMPWTQQGMCGFVQDSNPASTTVEFKAELVTEWRDIIMERGQLHQKLRSVAYLVTVKFIRELRITTGSVSVMVADPTRSPIDVTLTSALLFDPAISNIVFTFVTTLEWPYQIDTTGPMYAKYVPKYGVGEVTIYAIASSPQPGNLQCDETSSTLCEQEWQAVMIPGADVCTIQGSMVFNTTQMLCRDLDSMACPNAIDYETAFTMFTSAIRVCDDEVLDATAETTAALTTFMDREFYTPSNMYSIGDTAFFKVDIVDQRVSIDAIYVSQVDIWEGTVSQPLYPATDSFLKSIGFNFTNVVTTGDAPVAPGTPAQVVVWFDLSRSYINALAAIQADGLASLVVEITLDVSYHGNNKKREITAQLEIPTGSVSAAAQLSVLGVEENYLADASGAAMAVEDGETFEFFRSSASGLHPSSATITIVAGGLAALLILL